MSAEEASFRESVLKRLDEAIKRKNASQIDKTTLPSSDIQEFESSKFEEALSGFETLSFPQSRIFEKPPVQKSLVSETQTSTHDEMSGVKSEVIPSASEAREGSIQIPIEPKMSVKHSSDYPSTQLHSVSLESLKSSATEFSLAYLEPSSTSSSSSTSETLEVSSLDLDELAAYVMGEVLARLKDFKESEPKRGVILHGQDGSKISRRTNPSEVSFLSKSDEWRRRRTRILIEGMQGELQGESGVLHSLKPREVRDAMEDREFQDVSDEFRNVYGK